MKCKIESCGRDAMYAAQCVCQKHYFRFMRNGFYDLQEKRGNIQRIENQKGYQLIFSKGHPLAMKNGYVYEHRHVVYERYGENLPDCEICGSPTKWETCHVDHKDENIKNNDLTNLRPVCRGCNTSRTERRGIDRYEHNGKRLSIVQWAQQPEISPCCQTIKRRMAAGLSFSEAIAFNGWYRPNRM